MAELLLSSERRDGSLIVKISGELDFLTSPELDSLLQDGMREFSWIILDLARVDFMDTHSLAVIVKYWKKMTAAGKTLMLAGARYQYTKAIWITGLASRLPMYDSVEEAIAAARSAQPAAEDPPA